MVAVAWQIDPKTLFFYIYRSVGSNFEQKMWWQDGSGKSTQKPFFFFKK
jgi:hypothetical protein